MEALKMERPMGSWNDERLDELVGRVATKEDLAVVATRGELAEVKSELGELKVELGELKGEVGGLKGEVGGLKGEIGEVKVELRRLNERFDRLLLALMVGGASLGVTVLATLAGLVVTQA